MLRTWEKGNKLQHVYSTLGNYATENYCYKENDMLCCEVKTKARKNQLNLSGLISVRSNNYLISSSTSFLPEPLREPSSGKDTLRLEDFPH